VWHKNFHQLAWYTLQPVLEHIEKHKDVLYAAFDPNPHFEIYDFVGGQLVDLIIAGRRDDFAQLRACAERHYAAGEAACRANDASCKVCTPEWLADFVLHLLLLNWEAEPEVDDAGAAEAAASQLSSAESSVPSRG